MALSHLPRSAWLPLWPSMSSPSTLAHMHISAPPFRLPGSPSAIQHCPQHPASPLSNPHPRVGPPCILLANQLNFLDAIQAQFFLQEGSLGPCFLHTWHLCLCISVFLGILQVHNCTVQAIPSPTSGTFRTC